jgi:hypothetical protein
MTFNLWIHNRSLSQPELSHTGPERACLQTVTCHLRGYRMDALVGKRLYPYNHPEFSPPCTVLWFDEVERSPWEVLQKNLILSCSPDVGPCSIYEELQLFNKTCLGKKVFLIRVPQLSHTYSASLVKKLMFHCPSRSFWICLHSSAIRQRNVLWFPWTPTRSCFTKSKNEQAEKKLRKV